MEQVANTFETSFHITYLANYSVYESLYVFVSECVCVYTAYTKLNNTEFTPQWRPLVIPYPACWEGIVWEKYRQKSREELWKGRVG